VTVEQVAALAVFFCSGATAPIAGANIRMDGGRRVG
jgi:enoyl-[acyl-carrier-protein] reductase (NADH)